MSACSRRWLHRDEIEGSSIVCVVERMRDGGGGKTTPTRQPRKTVRNIVQTSRDLQPLAPRARGHSALV